MRLLRHMWNSIHKWRVWRYVGGVQLVGLLLLITVAITVAQRYQADWQKLLDDLFSNVATELMSIVFTILVLDILNKVRLEREHKRFIIQQMGSPVNDAALEAVRIARIEGWLEDGSLRRAVLEKANLQGADLKKANLQGAKLQSAKLQKAVLQQVNLRGADLLGVYLQNANLIEANLQGARLWSANLEEAFLWGANLQKALLRTADLRSAHLSNANLTGADLLDTNLQEAILDQETILPNGSHWAPNINLSPFTNPNDPASMDIDGEYPVESD